ncbi:hypothetical protein OE88DRAFT_1643052 [Heliocybe sulcata]|uniref:Uncharacterized protein n=1 Tax=Heliocybe sulcata TaxID=5364 RepID=A0A5C3NBC2_9AGAM|nr:hypothetical protein OE88DRAFT_1643052 [Heliocybe sulcata]
MAREEAQRRFPLPGRKGATVYEWCVLDETRNIHRRCIVNRNNVGDMWGSQDRKYMVYDAVDNCWDCYQEIYPPQYTIDSYEDDGEDDDDFGEGITFMPPPTVPSAPVNAPSTATIPAPRAGPSTSQAASRPPPPSQNTWASTSQAASRRPPLPNTWLPTSQAASRPPPPPNTWPSTSQAASRPPPPPNTWPPTSQAASRPPPPPNTSIVPNAPLPTHRALEDDFMYYTSRIIETVELEQPPFYVVLCQRYGLMSSIIDNDQLDVANHADFVKRMHGIAAMVKGRLPRVYMSETVALLDALAEDRSPPYMRSDLTAG